MQSKDLPGNQSSERHVIEDVNEHEPGALAEEVPVLDQAFIQ
jgi:hypothetical protein